MDREASGKETIKIYPYCTPKLFLTNWRRAEVEGLTSRAFMMVLIGLILSWSLLSIRFVVSLLKFSMWRISCALFWLIQPVHEIFPPGVPIRFLGTHVKSTVYLTSVWPCLTFPGSWHLRIRPIDVGWEYRTPYRTDERMIWVMRKLSVCCTKCVKLDFYLMVQLQAREASV